MWIAVLAKVRGTRKRIKAAWHQEHQFLLFLELGIIAYLVASIFGTYYSISFTYIMLAYSWLAAEVLGRERWYVPPNADRVASPAQAVGRTG
jgi:hypothetical protein